MTAFPPVIVRTDNILGKNTGYRHNFDVKFINNKLDQVPISTRTCNNQNLR